MWLWISILVYISTKFLCGKFKHPLSNPLLISLVVIISLLLLTGVDYQYYYQQNGILSDLLQPAIVAMAYPIYEQLNNIRKNIKLILVACVLGSLFSMLSGGLLALWMGARTKLIISILPKCVTVPIAMAATTQLGGDISVTAILVLFAGLIGSIIAYPIFNLMGIEGRLTKGLTIGAASHALGTVQAMDRHSEEAAYSSLSLVLCGVVTSLCAPVIYSVIVWLA